MEHTKQIAKYISNPTFINKPQTNYKYQHKCIFFFCVYLRFFFIILIMITCRLFIVFVFNIMLFF